MYDKRLRLSISAVASHRFQAAPDPIAIIYTISMYEKPKTLWYFAYGSNMSSSKFTGGRGIIPISSVRVRIPGWKLVMEIPGMPYSEPSFSSITPHQNIEAEKELPPDVIGVAYLITVDQYRLVVASEGGGIAYYDICLSGEPIDLEARQTVGPQVMLRTLGTALSRQPRPIPSKRYMVRQPL